MVSVIVDICLSHQIMVTLFKIHTWLMVYGGCALIGPYASNLSTTMTRCKGIEDITFGASLPAGVARSLSALTANHFQVSTPDFLDLLPQLFLCLNMATRQGRFKIRVFPPVDDCLHGLMSSICPKQLVMRHQWSAITPSSNIKRQYYGIQDSLKGKNSVSKRHMKLKFSQGPQLKFIYTAAPTMAPLKSNKIFLSKARSISM